VKRFVARELLPVRPPYRLDLTVDALRRLASNAVDVVAEDGTLYRALHNGRQTAILAIRPHDGQTIEVESTDRDLGHWLPVVVRMLGTQVDLEDWYARSARIPWLARLATELRGLRPPRYPSLWEACAHSILFQQISIHAAGSIMRRAIEALAEPATAAGVTCFPFPGPQIWIDASDETLRQAGLSRNKVAHVRSVAAAFLDGRIDESMLTMLSTPDAAKALCEVKGIGPWSAAVVMLRGLGRLDTFPLRDSGVARSLTLLSGTENLDQDALLAKLGPSRGMLYYHLLLGRLRNLVPV
jgi:DNA-3-methyladenine glycosylase II